MSLSVLCTRILSRNDDRIRKLINGEKDFVPDSIPDGQITFGDISTLKFSCSPSENTVFDVHSGKYELEITLHLTETDKLREYKDELREALTEILSGNQQEDLVLYHDYVGQPAYVTAKINLSENELLSLLESEQF